MPKKHLKMRRLKIREIGLFRTAMLHMLHDSPDPYASLIYPVDIGPSRKLLAELASQPGPRITLTPLFNKMLALAVAENPLFNQLVLGSGVYQMEGIHIANGFIIPGPEEILAPVVLENPQLKPLAVIQQEFRALRDAKTLELSKPPSMAAVLALGVLAKLHIFRLISEKRLFKIGFEKGLVSNILFMNHMHDKPATYIVIKPVIGKISLRVHAHAPYQQVVLENGKPVSKDIVLFNVSIDHRLIHGLHAQRFGESLQAVAADPERHLL